MFFDSDLAADDVLSAYGGVKVVVDPTSANLLTGSTLDFKDGLRDAGFSINNPNATCRSSIVSCALWPTPRRRERL
jgi:Fe-S cluster assembly iron-binding protein IscA